jgi:hypothetical protein
MKNVLIILSGFLLFVSCRKDKVEDPQPTPVASSVQFRINYEVDGSSFIFDSLIYQNNAGNNYSVYLLQYFLTQVSLIKADSSMVLISSCQYLDAALPSTNQFTVNGIPDGNYIGISFIIGVDSLHNLTGGLPNNAENNNMEWPDAMGGGYHFMKFEGHFLSHDTLYGFNMHLGQNGNQVPVKLFDSMSFNHSGMTYNMTMNLNEWFRNPAVFDFNTDGNYTMNNMMAMQKLSMNGTDVFAHY